MILYIFVVNGNAYGKDSLFLSFKFSNSPLSFTISVFFSLYFSLSHTLLSLSCSGYSPLAGEEEEDQHLRCGYSKSDLEDSNKFEKLVTEGNKISKSVKILLKNPCANI